MIYRSSAERTLQRHCLSDKMKIVLASNNNNKLREIKNMLLPLEIEVISQREAGADFEVEETGKTFEENALLKAEAVYKKCKCAVIADDSGLEVDYLNKAPGVYSHRYAGENADDHDRCNKIIKELDGVEENKRTARFVCAMQYINEKGEIYTVREAVEGKIGYKETGTNGFGYDPIFMYNGRSFAEIPEEEKNKVSHRANALKKLVLKLRDEVK